VPVAVVGPKRGSRRDQVNSPPLAEREFLLLTRCLEDRERNALRICHHSHAANIFNLQRFVATTSQSETNK
jgi:hypothetical protein